jgi:hypothetical protein
MRTAPAFSIGTSKRSRDAKLLLNAPGPGAYTPQDHRSTTPPSHKIGTAHRDDLRRQSTPGPGAYDSPGKISRSTPKFPFGIKTLTDWKSIGPGPGCYDANFRRSSDRKSPAFTFRMKLSRSNSMKTPGPGAYDQSMKLLKKSAPSAKIGTAKRDDIYRLETSPGPGAYTTRPVSAFESNNAPKMRFGTEPKDRDPLMEYTKTCPGPGSYNFFCELDALDKGRTIIPRRSDATRRSLEGNPGPGSYTPTLTDRPRAPTCRIGTSERSHSAERVKTPGPTDYDTDTMWRKPRVCAVIGTSKRVLTEMTPTPGPGAYDIPLKILSGPKYPIAMKYGDAKDKNTPGPGAYTPSVKLIRKRAPSCKVGTGKRNDSSKGHKNPGPGTYDLRTQRVEGPKWLFTTTDRTEKSLATEPGPGTYNVPSKFAEVPTYAYGRYPLKIHL